MTRECHVRFCERLRGQFLWPTHLFGMKAHIGADAESGLVHHVHGTAANVADVTEVAHLLHGDENVICADAGYIGVEKRPEHEGRPVIWQVAARRSKLYQGRVFMVSSLRPGILDVAVIGSGRMATVHAQSISQHERARLAVIVDPFAASRDALASLHGAATAKSLEDAIAASAIDAVVVTSPSETHADYIEMCVQRGIPVLCEKPVDLSLERVDRCLENIAGKDVPVVVGFHRRFDAARAEIRELVRRGELGALTQVIQISRDPRLPSLEYIGHSGGFIRDMLVHDLDELIWLVGDGPVTVYTELRRSDEELAASGDHDLARIAVSFENGPQCTVYGSRKCAYGFDQRLEVFGTQDMASCPNIPVSMVQRAVSDGFRQSRLLDHFPQRYAEAYKAEFDHFVRVARGEEESRSTVQDARLSLALAELANTSHQRQAPVSALTLRKNDQ